LYNWVKSQQKYYHNRHDGGPLKKLSLDQITRLRSLGVDFQTKEDKWNEMYEEASALYDEKSGEIVRPKGRLRHWIYGQKKSENIPPYQVEKLQKLGILKKG
jgi:hypothetical protein